MKKEQSDSSNHKFASNDSAENQSLYTIQTKTASAKIQTKGAELSSLKVSGKEYIWQGDPEIWSRHSPVLFPIVGRLKDHEYYYKGKTFGMGQHGFARDNDFKMIERSENSVKFEQVSNEETKKIYPFDFSLQLKYTLNDNVLKVEYRVLNTSSQEPLFFSLGTHPAFICPLEESHKRSEYALVFDKKESPKTKDKIDGLYIQKRTEVFKEPGILKLTDDLFDDDSLTFNPNPFSKASLVHVPENKKYLTMTFEDYPYLGIWSPLNVPPFVCIEPWHGISDNFDHNKEWTEKEGIIQLAPKDHFECSWTVEIH